MPRSWTKATSVSWRRDLGDGLPGYELRRSPIEVLLRVLQESRKPWESSER